MPKRTKNIDFDNDVEMFRLLQNNQEGENNSARIRALKRAVAKVITQEITPRQKQFIVLYYYNNKNMCEIAKMFGINKSTVSRTINRARMNILKYTKYYLK